MSSPRKVRERPHRLPREFYQGEVAVAFTACVADGQPLFAEAEVVNAFVSQLGASAERNRCSVLIYCFMPDHLHVILQGNEPSADTWKAMVDFKQQSGFWLRKHRLEVRWQKDFYDHVVRANEDLGAQVRYVANNPVRRGLVQNWEDYPFTGAIGIDVKAVIEGAITL
jgi:putative transposase